ncbi:hypothetical protein [Rhodopseudomonas sp. B29]|uniref:hypothetical protein n=1 Tax=Rhodopseudomonas sp. B29 TaxID=95607 RepID=UPI00131EDE3E|nr:hypothetical protein [Rhodopseudomonas sp. B29]
MSGIHNENDEMVRAFTAEVEASGATDYTEHGKFRPPVTASRSSAHSTMPASFSTIRSN